MHAQLYAWIYVFVCWLPRPHRLRPRPHYGLWREKPTAYECALVCVIAMCELTKRLWQTLWITFDFLVGWIVNERAIQKTAKTHHTERQEENVHIFIHCAECIHVACSFLLADSDEEVQIVKFAYFSVHYSTRIVDFREINSLWKYLRMFRWCDLVT